MKQGRGRRRRINVYSLLVIVVLVGMLFSICNIWKIKADLRNAQVLLKRLENIVFEGNIPISEISDTAGEGSIWGIQDGKGNGANNADKMISYAENASKAGVEGSDFIQSIGTIDVEKPVKRTYEEVIKKLEELGQKNLVVKEIYKNRKFYPEELLAALANNPEMASFVLGYSQYEDGERDVSLREEEKEQQFPLFLQWDPRWGYQSYGKESCIGVSGCGPTCVSMALYYLTRDESITPDKLAAIAVKNGYYVEGAGTSWSFMDDVPEKYGVRASEVSAEESAIIRELDKGAVIICSMGRGDFTASGHFIVIYGYDKDGFKVNDPNCVARSNRRWSFEEIQHQIKKIWAYRG